MSDALRYSFLLGEVNFVAERIKLYGIGDSEIVTMGRFDIGVGIDGCEFKATF